NDGTVSPSVILKCSALAAQEHGDARKALDLLRVAGELVEREGEKKITTKHIDRAEERLDTDRVTTVISSQPKQSQAVLAAIINLADKGQRNVQTGDVFSVYEGICSNRGLKVLTQRRVSDLIAELDMLGIINARVISKGRYGRTKEIRTQLGKPTLKRIRKILADSYLLTD
ncbi:MAG: cell division control protein Cdc6, partial [Candidatus Aenigmatarchaeota archaeon]